MSGVLRVARRLRGRSERVGTDQARALGHAGAGTELGSVFA